MAHAIRLSWICLLTALVAGQELRAEKAPSTSLPTSIDVEILLTVSDTLSVPARAALTRETESIWRRHGVTIHWLSPTDQSPPGQYRLRALIVEKRAIPAASGNLAVGELVRLRGNDQMAFVSIEDAQRLVACTRWSMGDVVVLKERRLGVTLGRALAHEIGHFLLRTSTHARSGLMRSQFTATEFTDLRDGAFALDRDAAEWLRMRDVETFAYASR